MTAREILRLRDVDAALASREGLHLGALAARHGCSTKTIRRDQALLAELVGAITARQVPADNEPGRSWRHWYQDRRRQLFRGRTGS